MITSTEVPHPYDVAIDGHPYMLDTAKDLYTRPFTNGRETIPLLRNQSDVGAIPGEQSQNPEDLWSRGRRSWHRGAGQEFADRDESDPYRFRASLGVDVWTQNRLGLLHDVNHPRTSTNAAQKLLSVGSDAYLLDGNALLRTTSGSLSAWTTITTPTPAGFKLTDIATDGNFVYAAINSYGLGTGRVVSVAPGATSSVDYMTNDLDVLDYVKGRLMGARLNAVFNFTSAVPGSGTPDTTTALYTHPNSGFQWVDFAEGPGYIYAAGYAGDKSLIYKTAVKSDGTALDVPVVAGELPDGEIVRSIQGYLGYLIVGSDLGFRVASLDSTGNLTLGALVNIGSRVGAFEPQDRFIYFAWSMYDSSHTGVGRMDLSQFTAPNVPAYATDLMASTTSSKAVTSIVTFNGDLAFTVSTAGVYTKSTGLVSSGTIDSGFFEYGLPDNKIALELDIKHPDLSTGTSIVAYITSDRGTPSLVGSVSGVGPLNALHFEKPAYSHEVRLIFNSGETGGTIYLDRYDLKAFPSSSRGETVIVPILLYDNIEVNGLKVSVDPLTEYNRLRAYVGSASQVSFQELGETSLAIVDQVQFERHAPTADRSWWNGCAICKLKILGGT